MNEWMKWWIRRFRNVFVNEFEDILVALIMKKILVELLLPFFLFQLDFSRGV